MSDTIAATSVTAVLGSWAGKIVALTILISTFSAANSVILTAPRVFYAMAKDKLFFMKLAEVHPRFRTPAAAIIGLGVWSAVLVCAGELGTFSKTDRRRNFYRLDFLRSWRRRHFPHSPRLGRTAQFLIVFLAILGRLSLRSRLVAAIIVGNAIYLAFLDPSKFMNLRPPSFCLSSAFRLLLLAQTRRLSRSWSAAA